MPKHSSPRHPEPPCCSSAARDTLPETLAAAGATLTLAEAYQTIIPESSITALRDLFNAGPQLDAITFTSASTAQNLAALLESAGLTLPPATTLASIGPITSQAMRDLGLSPTLEASESTILALLEALGKHFTTF